MKKSIFLTALSCFVAFNVNAVSVPQAEQVTQDPAMAPRLYFGAVDAKNLGRGFLENKNQFYQRYPNRQLCWEVMNIPDLGDTADVIEEFTSPAKTTFPNAQTSADGKRHKITTKMNTLKLETGEKFIQKCWQLDKTDPLGEYSVRILVNSTEFPVQKFKLNK